MLLLSMHKTLSIFVFLIIMLPKCEFKVEPSVVLLHCRRKDQQQGHDLDCDIHGVTIKKPNQYEFKVACPFQNSYERVREIVFEKSKVEFLPKSLFNTLRNVQKAEISRVTLKSIHPEAFFYAKYLETLDLSDNLLELLGPKEFIGAKNLKTLNLNNNQIYFIDDEAFEGLLALETLNLERNQLKSVSSTALTPLSKLKRFDLSENHLTKTEQEFCNNRTLVVLKLNRNGLKDLKCHDARIETLSLSGNQLDHLSADSFLVIKGLLKLDISYNLLNTPSIASLSNSLELEHLNLSRNNIKKLNQRSFNNALHVKVLDLSYNQLEELDAFSLSTLKELEMLYIDGNSLVQFDFVTLRDTHHNLRLVSIADNEWNCHYFDKILQTFCTTNVTVKYDNGIACKDLKGDVIIPIDRSPDQNINRRAAKFSEQLWFYFLLLTGASISLYLAFFVFKKYCLNRILLT